MRRLSLGLIAVVSTVALSQIASAADMPVKAPVYKAPVVKVINWQGFYVGGHVGYGWDPADATFNPVTYVTSVVPTFTPTSNSGPVNLSVSPKGALGGLQLGYNWQQNSLVYGLEADFSWAGIKGSSSAPWFVNGNNAAGYPGGITGNVGLDQKLDYFGTLRGRLGWANDALLLYATGGLAWGHVKTTFSNNNVLVSQPLAIIPLTPTQVAALQAGGSASSSSVRWGYAVGGGLEWMFSHNWSARAEYLFIDLRGSDTLTIVGGSASAGNMSVQVARFGLNYLFH